MIMKKAVTIEEQIKRLMDGEILSKACLLELPANSKIPTTGIFRVLVSYV